MSTTPNKYWRWDEKALEVARQFTQDSECQRRASLQCAVVEAMQFAYGQEIADIAKGSPMTTKPVDAERAAFEAWAKTQGYDTSQAHSDSITRWLNPMTRDLYLAWLEGRAALAAPRPPAPVERKPLTLDQLSYLAPGTVRGSWSDFVCIARAIEHAHGIQGAA